MTIKNNDHIVVDRERDEEGESEGERERLRATESKTD